jgi:hypothetical protein
VTALLSPTSLSAATLGSLQEKLNTAISPGNADTRVPAAKAVTEGWQDSLPVLIQNISTYYQSDGKSYSHETIAKLLPLRDLLVSIVETKDGAIEKFREVDTSETVDVLTLAAASDDRDLRLNASSVLYKVVDDDNLCIVFHRLRDPKLGSSGQLNLLQIAVWGANTAARENLQAAKETAEKLKASAEENPNQTSGDGDRALYVNTLDSLASGRERMAKPLPPNSYCARYNVDRGVAVRSESVAVPSETPAATPPPAAPSP